MNNKAYRIRLKYGETMEITCEVMSCVKVLEDFSTASRIGKQNYDRVGDELHRLTLANTPNSRVSRFGEISKRGN